jgi:hypothetical protein
MKAAMRSSGLSGIRDGHRTGKVTRYGPQGASRALDTLPAFHCLAPLDPTGYVGFSRLEIGGSGRGRRTMAKKWLVQLKGNNYDLEDLPALYSSPELTVINEGDGHYMHSTELDGCATQEEAKEWAVRKLGLISGAARVQDEQANPIRVGSFRLLEDGKQTVFLSHGTDALLVRDKARIELVGPGGTVECPHAGTPAPSWVSLADRDRTANTIIGMFEGDLNWNTLYRIFEAVQANAGNVASKGWASKNEITRFKHTANSRQAIGDEARHGHEKIPPPPNPMPLGEAQALIRRIAKHWLSDKDQVKPTTTP